MFTAALDFTETSPLKATVLKKLAEAVDDPKRVVREAAAKSRSTWYLLSGSK
jgi:hypothetical protein